MAVKQVLCCLQDIPQGGSKGFAANADAAYADIFVVRTHQGLYAYRNSCPHTGAPMEAFPDEFFDYEGRYIQCAIHGARFRIEDGYCVSGPCEHRLLDKFAIVVENGSILALEGLDRHNKRSFPE